jgi:hypothetical protein
MKYRLEISFIVESFEYILICHRKGMIKHYAEKISGGVDVKLHAFFTSALSNGECSLHSPAALFLLLDLLSSELH